jgi:hypothetical protein
MNRFFFWYAFWARPRTLLTLTAHEATLAPYGNPTKIYARLTPRLPLLNTQGTLAAGFQLRTFLDTSITSADKKPFSILVAVPSQSPQAHHLGIELCALLMQLKLPPYGITSAFDGSHTPITDIFRAAAHPSLRLFRGMVLTTGIFLLSTLTIVGTYAYWYTPSITPAAIHTVAAPTPRKIKKEPYPLYRLLVAAFTLHRWNNQFIKLEGTQKSHTYTSIMTQPAYTEIITKALSDATRMSWTIQKQRYRPGMPPLYEVTQKAENC